MYSANIVNDIQEIVWRGPVLYDDIFVALDKAMDQLTTMYVPVSMEIWLLEGWYGSSRIQKTITADEIARYALDRIDKANATELKAKIAAVEKICEELKARYEKGLLTPYDYSSDAENAWMMANGEIRSLLHMDD